MSQYLVDSTITYFQLNFSIGISSQCFDHVCNHVYISKSKREILMSTLRVLVKNPVKESFYGKRKKKTINVLIVFFISHESNVKTFLKWILKQCHTALVNMTLLIK